MVKVRLGSVLWVLVGTVGMVWGQSSAYVREVLAETEKALKVYGDSMIHGTTQGVRIFALTRFVPMFRSVLRYPEAFTYPFDSLPYLKKLTDPEGRFRIITWAVQFKDQSYRHYGVILRRRSKDSVEVWPLYDGSARLFESGRAFSAAVGRRQWPGAIYYAMQCFESEAHGPYCLLLGWNGASAKVRRRIIEPFRWAADTPLFGMPILAAEAGMRMREVLEYHPTATLTLRFDEKEGRPAVVFDHLVLQRLPGGGEGMVPDGTYDYYRLGTDGKWHKGAFFFGKGPAPPKSGR